MWLCVLLALGRNGEHKKKQEEKGGKITEMRKGGEFEVGWKAGWAGLGWAETEIDSVTIRCCRRLLLSWESLLIKAAAVRVSERASEPKPRKRRRKVSREKGKESGEGASLSEWVDRIWNLLIVGNWMSGGDIGDAVWLAEPWRHYFTYVELLTTPSINCFFTFKSLFSSFQYCLFF